MMSTGGLDQGDVSPCKGFGRTEYAIGDVEFSSGSVFAKAGSRFEKTTYLKVLADRDWKTPKSGLNLCFRYINLDLFCTYV